MKRAWPYALALAVVVTGCYLALTPLLRSLSPAPTRSVNRLIQGSNVTTVDKSRSVTTYIRGAQGTTTLFASNLTATKKQAKKVAKKPVKPATPQVPTPSSNATGFANNPPSSSSSNSAPKTTPKAPVTATKSSNRKNSAVGGVVDQTQQGTGFAGGTGGGTAPVGGQTLSPSGNN